MVDPGSSLQDRGTFAPNARQQPDRYRRQKPELAARDVGLRVMSAKAPHRAEHIVAVVDDDGLVRASMGSLLRAVGYSVELFESGPSLLAEDVSRFACVISDMQMPEMSGLALLERLQGVAPRCPFLFVTAIPDRWARSRALAGGACAFFEKPCDLDELVRTLEEVIARTS